MDTVRLFYAIPFDAEVRAELADTQRRLKEYIETHNNLEIARSLRWTSPTTFHLTLCFLGETNPRLLEKLNRAGLRAIADAVPFYLRLGRIGAFYRQGFVSVLWLGLSDGEGGAAHLADGLSRELAVAGVPVDRGPFQGHLTLARVKRPVKLTLPDFEAEVGSDISANVDRMVLMRSHLLPTGPVYEEVARFPLSAQNVEQNQVGTGHHPYSTLGTAQPKPQKQEI